MTDHVAFVDTDRTSGCKRAFGRLMPCFFKRDEDPPRGRISMPAYSRGRSYLSTNGGSFASCSEGAGCEPLDIVTNDLHQCLTVLESMDLPPVGVVAQAQIREGLAKLEALAATYGPSQAAGGSTSSTSPVHARKAPAGLELSAASPATPLTPSIQKKWRDAALCARVAEETSMRPGALAPALNQLVSLLWPRIDSYVEDLIRTSIEPSINSSLPGLTKVAFGNVSLGDSSPSFGPITVEHDARTGTIELHIGLRFASDLDVDLKAAGVPIGISKFFLEGTLAMRLAPPKSQPPFFGGIQVFFLNPPEIKLQFDGALRMVQIPGLRGAVQGAIEGAVASTCVLPRRIAVDMDEEDSVDLVDLTYPQPIGVLRLTVISGENLVAADISLTGARSSDPYVTAVLGVKSWQSPIITKTLNPVWGDGNGVTVDFPVHDVCQSLMIKVFDYDFASADDLIGVCDPLNVKDLGMNKEARRQELMLKTSTGEPGGGTLVVSTQFLRLSDDYTKALRAPPSEAHLSFKVLSAAGLDDNAAYPFTVRLRIGTDDSDEKSAHSSTEDVKKKSSSLIAGVSGVLASGVGRLTGGRRSGDGSRMSYHTDVSSDPSHPRVQEKLAETLQKVCAALSERSHEQEEIAEILGVETRQVEDFLTARDNPERAAKLAKEADERHAATKPCFDMVVQTLLPSAKPQEILDICLQDKTGKSIASTSLSMAKLLEAPGLMLHGFELEGPTGSSVQVVGSISLHWLC
eukprot:TRINITY_DN70609_c0_g1_i1.p1 TRINITY_DN70609_c0_g1~~TRINITY_DN70609_c0_g1_i1.p1  ORF type:complete len:746 (-),score=165.60 TRINITY_DN70609_c0_g1_i1:445-2682(-)